MSKKGMNIHVISGNEFNAMMILCSFITVMHLIISHFEYIRTTYSGLKSDYFIHKLRFFVQLHGLLKHTPLLGQINITLLLLLFTVN